MASIDTTIAVKFDITVKQNQTFNPLITFIDDNNDPIDLTGTTIKLSVRLKNGLCQNECSVNNSSFNQVYKQDFYPQITGAFNNQIQFNDIILLAHGIYVYDMLVVWPNGEQQYYLRGPFKVQKSYADANDN